jgi:F-type H+-transporting ATPase subunit b
MAGLGINPILLLWYVVNFLIVLLILRVTAYDPLMKMFDERRERIRLSLEEAEEVRRQASEERSMLQAQLEDERRHGQERLREAVSRSQEAAQKLVEEANAEAERIMAQARSDAEQARRQALAGLHDQIAELALAAAAKALGEGIDEATHRRLIDRFLTEWLGGEA